jgi:hypothetical protein
MAESMTHKYFPRIEQRQENLFIEEYYSSTDTKIYIDDEEQSEISYISYNLREQLKPIYGYSSRTFDDVAIGNRIVTGVFKVAIKNTEPQTSLETIAARSFFEAIEKESKYNDKQNELINSTEWITGEDNNKIVTAIIEDDETFDYKMKLIKLGYNLDYDSGAFIFKNQIIEFQKNNGLSQDGILTDETKKAIDKKLLTLDLKKITIKKETKIYLNPILNDANAIMVATNDMEVYVLNANYSDGWSYIMTEDGVEGWIKAGE